MRMEELNALKSLQIFRDVEANTFEGLLAPSFLQSFPAGTILLEENCKADFLYIILDGLVQMTASTSNSETTVEILEPVSLFILAAILNDDVCLQTARTLTSARILMIPARLVRDLMERDPAFMRSIVFELACAYRRTIKELKNHKLRSGTERLANWLLGEEKKQGGSGVLKIGLEKRLLASRLGMTPENLSRGLASLAAHGVSIKGSQVAIADTGKLAAYACPTPLIDESEPLLPQAAATTN